MPTCLPTKPEETQNVNLILKVDTVLEDLTLLYGFLSEISNLPNDQVKNLGIADHLDEVHRCLKRFVACCKAFKITLNEDSYEQESSDIHKKNLQKSYYDWDSVRCEAKRLKRLNNQIAESLNKIQIGLLENHDHGRIPEDILRIYQSLGNTENNLVHNGLI